MCRRRRTALAESNSSCTTSYSNTRMRPRAIRLSSAQAALGRTGSSWSIMVWEEIAKNFDWNSYHFKTRMAPVLTMIDYSIKKLLWALMTPHKCLCLVCLSYPFASCRTLKEQLALKAAPQWWVPVTGLQWVEVSRGDSIILGFGVGAIDHYSTFQR